MSKLMRCSLVAGLLLLSACSSTTFLYNRLHIIIPWYLGDYVDLDSQQDDQLDALVAPFLAWHREDELPRYMTLLDGMLASLDQPASAATVAAQALALESAWYRLEASAVDWMLELGEGLRDEQIDELLQQLVKDQQKYEKKYLPRSDEEYREDLYDNFLDNAQDFLGRLNTEQREGLRAAMATMTRSDDLWLRERSAWVDRLRAVLRRQPGWQQAIRADVGQRDQSVSPAYDEIMAHNLGVIHQAMADLLNSRTAKQDTRLRKKLAGFHDDLQTLIAQGPKT